MSLWNADRPVSLCNIYINNGSDTVALSSDTDSMQANYLRQLAQGLGVPLIWPLYDTQDQQHISLSNPPTTTNTVSLLPSNIQTYWQQRYGASSLLYGIVWSKDNAWYGSWLISL